MVCYSFDEAEIVSDEIKILGRARDIQFCSIGLVEEFGALEIRCEIDDLCLPVHWICLP